MEPTGIFLEINYVYDWFTWLYGIIKLHVNYFWSKLICLFAVPIFMYILFLPNGGAEYIV
jgi:hypothetical protein